MAISIALVAEPSGLNSRSEGCEAPREQTIIIGETKLANVIDLFQPSADASGAL